MQSILISTALAASAFSSLGHAAVAAVRNNCGSPMYLWSVGDVASEMVEIPDKMTIYNETYRARDNLGGISIKICGSDSLSTNQTQFEYTMDPGTGTIWYDLSNVDGNALSNVEYKLEASDSACPVVHCASQDVQCKAVYNQPKDDHATHACGIDADLILTLCPQNSGAGSPETAAETTPSPTPDAQPKADDQPDSIRADVIVNPDGSVSLGSGKVYVPESDGTADSTTDAPRESDGEITYVHPVFLPRKRSEHRHHALEHTHQRIRRSRIFRRD